MKIAESAKSAQKWAEEHGIGKVQVEDVPSLEYVLAVARDLDELDLSDLDEVLEKMSMYAVYLAHQKGRVEAELRMKERKFKRELGIASERLLSADGSRKFRTYDERTALAVSMSSKLQKLERSICELEAKFNCIRDLPRAIDNRVMTLRKIYDRRVNEERRGTGDF